MKLKRYFAFILVVSVFCSSLVACQATGNLIEETLSDIPVLDEGTITFLYKGSKTEGWDNVYEEFLAQTEGSLNTNLEITWVDDAVYSNLLNLEVTSGTNYDLVFDASWLQLKNLSRDGYYADLSYYFGNEDYEGLYEAFPTEVMESNTWYDYMCYIPIYESFGNGIGCVYYRQDWADEWGLGEIDSYGEMETYWEKCLEIEVTPLSVTSSNGFFQLFTIGGSAFEGSVAAGIESFNIGGLTVWTYINNGKVVSVSADGAGDENFATFPEGWDYDFTVERYEYFNTWQNSGYLSVDSTLQTDATTPFYLGQSGSHIATLVTYSTVVTNLTNNIDGAELGYFIYSSSARNMEDGAVPTTYIANNGLCVLATSNETERVMQFMNWIHSSADNHDLLQNGVEGEDWIAVGDNQYEPISDYSTIFPSYSLTLSPLYGRYSTTIPEDVIEYQEWLKEETTYIQLQSSGFVFDYSSTTMTNYVAQISGVVELYSTKAHGYLTNGSENFDTAEEMMNAMYEDCVDVGLEEVLKELKTQLNEYLAS